VFVGGYLVLAKTIHTMRGYYTLNLSQKMFKLIFFPTSIMKMILLSLNLVRKMEKVNSLVKKIYLTIYYINNLPPTNNNIYNILLVGSRPLMWYIVNLLN
jgi:hypothetical protein